MGCGPEKPVGGAGGAETTGLWVRNGWVFAATERGWKPVKPPNPLGGWPAGLLELPSQPLVPGAPEEKDGVLPKAGLKEGGGPAAGGGRGGSDAWAEGVEDDGVWFCLRPGGGGYDMMNVWTWMP